MHQRTNDLFIANLPSFIRLCSLVISSMALLGSFVVFSAMLCGGVEVGDETCGRDGRESVV